MADVVRDAIAAELALITPVVRTPVAPFGYGTDVSCSGRLDPSRLVSGQELLGQALSRRLDCPRGALPDDQGYGLSLSEYLNTGTRADELRDLASRVHSELQKDDRVATLRVPTELSPTGQSIRVRIFVRPVDARVGPFSMVLAATSAGVVLEAMGR